MKLINIIGHKLFDDLSDETYLKIKYLYRMKKMLNLENPQTYNEKLQWIKLYDRKSIYTTMVDKCEAKKFVAELIGPEYIIPTYGVWNNVDEIDFDELPEEFVLKCTHDSGSVIICKDKKSFSYDEAREKLRRSLEKSAFKDGREWPYKNVERKIIAEKYMIDAKDEELRDYKFFTFNGEPKILYIAQGRGKGEETVADFFDMEFNHLDLRIDHEMAEELPHPPKNFELMINLARKLSQGTPELRVDFYEVNGQVYFGEMTFFHCSGFWPFRPEKWDHILGEWINLPPKKTL